MILLDYFLNIILINWFKNNFILRKKNQELLNK